jgi:hypothetical protein
MDSLLWLEREATVYMMCCVETYYIIPSGAGFLEGVGTFGFDACTVVILRFLGIGLGFVRGALESANPSVRTRINKK